ncbi:HET-domain-containing protein [Epithele typhae]|uniref:HET-domain-containing protein n=1 Tax=Epithele typhae TaxID=378194 RepID=UPI0020085A8F|nr:HET-domain-containing protein [Epithele typhae]KAH9942150.1 HET-domain-containing protein [Epithele typhae]
MWLLNTHTAELRFFTGPEDVSGGYVILSHVWGNASDEDTFQQLRMHSELHTHWDVPRHYVSEKIRRFLSVAEDYGYHWAWADTCCIDKTSSAELTEAINSMFRYYQLADLCFVYLHDVTFSRRTRDLSTRINGSRWHKRGWTLQELIAPKMVVFMSAEWRRIGTKYELARNLQIATGIPESVLRLEADVTDVSIAARMAWASGRETTRVEDEAYCLFGLFGVNLPPLYGEGRNAFYRLQEEIMRTSVDVSLVAWGRGEAVGDLTNIVKIANGWSEGLRAYNYLLAPSVKCFMDHNSTRYHPHSRHQVSVFQIYP